VVVNWNGAHLLGPCLDALRVQTLAVQVVVVDNGSTDASAAVAAARPGVEWIPLGENTGFAAAANAGIRRALAAGARLVALVNNDVALAPDWLERLAADADFHPEAGLFNGTLLFQDDPVRVNSTGLAFDRLLRARDRDFGAPAGRPRPDGAVPAATFGAVLLRAKALRRIGLLDPAYFAYCEDADLSLRAARAGIACRYVAAARALHGYARTSGPGSPLQRYLLARNHLVLAAAHLPAPSALVVVPALALLRAVIRAPLALFRGEPAHARAQLRAAAHGLAGAARVLARRALRRRGPPPGAEI
jgi:GT2 family glycosyltransferase